MTTPDDAPQIVSDFARVVALRLRQARTLDLDAMAREVDTIAMELEQGAPSVVTSAQPKPVQRPTDREPCLKCYGRGDARRADRACRYCWAVAQPAPAPDLAAPGSLWTTKASYGSPIKVDDTITAADILGAVVAVKGRVAAFGGTRAPDRLDIDMGRLDAIRMALDPSPEGLLLCKARYGESADPIEDMRYMADLIDRLRAELAKGESK